MELRNIKSFIKVAEFENFSKAAEALGYAQSTITIQIQLLEDELGVSLFDRIGKKVFLSEKGRQFLAYANTMVKLEEEALEEISENSSPSGLLQIGIIESIVYSTAKPILEEFLQKYPAVTLEIKIGTNRELLSLLEKGLLDAVLLIDDPIFRPDLETIFTFDSHIFFFCAPGHPFAGKQVPPKNLETETFFLTEKNCNYRNSFDKLMEKNGIPINYCMECGITSYIIDFAAKGMGVSVLPDYCLAGALRERKISTFAVEGCDIQMQIQMLRHKQKWVSLAARRFFEIACRHLSAENAGMPDPLSKNLQEDQ